MDTKCDRCCARALETWLHQQRADIVRLCGHHGRQHQMALHAQGFRLVEAERAELDRHPSLGPVTADPVTH